LENFFAGEFNDTTEIWLRTNGGFWLTDFDEGFQDITRIEINDFYQPKIILSNFIERISQSAENRKQQLTELEMARRIIEAIGGTSKKASFKSKIKKSDKNRQGNK